VSFALRALVLLAAVTPLFAATAFHPAWWQTLVAAAIGSGLGHLAVRITRGRRGAQWAVIVVAALVAAAAAAWMFRRPGGHDATESGLLVVKPVTADDIRQIKAELTSVDLAVPYLHSSQQLVSEDMNWNTQVVGTTPDYFDLMNLTMATGERFEETPDKVVVLGDTVAMRLYGASNDPVGQEVRIRSVRFKVIGVLAHRGMSAQGQDLDDMAIVPLETYSSKVSASGRFDGVALILPKSPADRARVEEAVRELLRARHQLGTSDADDFTIRTPK
jgi:putative ABC transport system permease protein